MRVASLLLLLAAFACASDTGLGPLPASAVLTAPGPIGATTPSTGAFTTLSASGAITSTLATGTAPFTVASTTVVGNLNVSQLLGATWAAPGTIGSGTPSTGAFTTLSATSGSTTKPLSVSWAQATAYSGGTLSRWETVRLTNTDTSTGVATGIAGIVGSQQTSGIAFIREALSTDTGHFAVITSNAGTYGERLRVDNVGQVMIQTAGRGLSVKEGSNCKMGVSALVGGTVTVSTTAVTTSSRIFLTSNTDGGTPGWLRVSARVNGTSFTITSSSGSDTSTVAWILVEPSA